MKFGLELEFASQVEPLELVERIARLGVNIIVKRYGHEDEQNIDYDFKIVQDGSVRGARHGLELVSKPFTNLQVFTSDLRIILKVLKKADCEVNISTGLHVHHCIETHGLSQADIYNMVRWYSQNDELIFKMLAKHRHFNFFCKPYSEIEGRLRNTDISYINDIFTKMKNGYLRERDDERYHSVNILSQLKYNTIEFRQKESTFDIDDILRWIEFTNACMVYAKKFKVYNEFRRHAYDIDEVQSMFKKLQLDFIDYRDYYV